MPFVKWVVTKQTKKLINDNQFMSTQSLSVLSLMKRTLRLLFLLLIQ